MNWLLQRVVDFVEILRSLLAFLKTRLRLGNRRTSSSWRIQRRVARLARHHSQKVDSSRMHSISEARQLTSHCFARCSDERHWV